MYDMPALYQAAVVVSSRSSEEKKQPKLAEVYGTDVTDVVFGGGGMAVQEAWLPPSFAERETGGSQRETVRRRRRSSENYEL